MRSQARNASRRSARVALAFAYDGGLFDSFARQPGRRTVEGELIRALRAGGALKSSRTARFAVASRTDAGVSALRNVCAVDSSMDPRTIPHVVDPPPGLWLLSAAAVDPSFDPRRQATARTYTYTVLDPSPYDWKEIRRGAKIFQGLHDFQNFCRPDRDVPTHRSLTRIAIESEGGMARFRLQAPNFLWEQVRRMVHALLEVGAGRRDVASIRRQLEATTRDPEPPAAPRPLVLWDVEVPCAFPAPSKVLRRRLGQDARSARQRAAFYADLAASVPTARR
jgi:tRNA pseudouridine38-40 synthase